METCSPGWGVVLEQLLLSASPELRVIAQGVVRPLMAQSSITILFHPVTQTILLQLDPTVWEHDIYYICGRGGTKRSGVRQWIAFSIEILQGWPTFSYVAVGAFLPRRQRKAEAKARRQERKKGRVVVVPRSSGVAIVPDPTHVDSSAVYVPPRDVSGAEGSTQRTQLARAAKLHRRIVVDAEDSAHPDPESDAGSCSGSGSDGGSGSGSGKSSGSGSASGSSSGSDATSSASPLAVPMWRQPLLLHQLRKNFARQECTQANAQFGHCLPPPLMLMQNPLLPQYPIS